MKRIAIVLSIIIITPIVMYFINPTGTASLDPRARIMGFVTYQIPSRSMSPTLQPGDYIIVSTVAYMNDEPDINDVIVFKYPEDRDIIYLMRVVALSEQTIATEGGKVMVDGKAIAQPYVDPNNNAWTSNKDFKPVKVPKGALFVLGDNRDNSRDSRFWGFLPRADVIGKVKLIWASDDPGRVGKSVE